MFDIILDLFYLLIISLWMTGVIYGGQLILDVGLFHSTHILLRFNYAVEIGAYLAYKGHYKRTNDLSIRYIAREELKHRCLLRRILKDHKKQPFFLFNWIFKVIGSTIGMLCQISPVFLLDYVAEIMEMFAIVNYEKLIEIYPEYTLTFREIIRSEENHRKFFSRR